MAKGPWRRNPLTGLPERFEVDLTEARRHGCDLFDVASIAPLYDVTKRYFRDVVVRRARDIGVHFVELKTPDGVSVGYAIRLSSGEHGAKMYKAYCTTQLTGIVTDPTGGSVR